MSANPPPPQSADKSPAPAQYAWQTCLNVEDAPTTPYQEHFNPQLLDVLVHAPRTLLDVGCSTGLLGHFVKGKYPGCRAMGIEPNRASATVAAKHLDQVLYGKLEDFVLHEEGVPLASVDTVVLADVLEHMYDPWRAMVNLRPYLAPDAQLILSVPNTRHLGLLGGLVDGGLWTYAERGLLDITHIRFFTLREIEQFLRQTGYRIEFVNHFLDANLVPFYEANSTQAKADIRFGRVTLAEVTPRELAELCTWQFFIRARLA